MWYTLLQYFACAVIHYFRPHAPALHEWRYKFYHISCKTDFTRPKTEWNVYVYHTKWDVTNIFHGHGLLLLDHICYFASIHTSHRGIYILYPTSILPWKHSICRIVSHSSLNLYWYWVHWTFWYICYLVFWTLVYISIRKWISLNLNIVMSAFCFKFNIVLCTRTLHYVIVIASKQYNSIVNCVLRTEKRMKQCEVSASQYWVNWLQSSIR